VATPRRRQTLLLVRLLCRKLGLTRNVGAPLVLPEIQYLARFGLQQMRIPSLYNTTPLESVVRKVQFPGEEALGLRLLARLVAALGMNQARVLGQATGALVLKLNRLRNLKAVVCVLALIGNTP
jgi:hypothetical protein